MGRAGCVSPRTPVSEQNGTRPAQTLASATQQGYPATERGSPPYRARPRTTAYATFRQKNCTNTRKTAQQPTVTPR